MRPELRNTSRGSRGILSISPVRRRLVRILEEMTDAIVAYDPTWRYVYLNRRAEAHLGRPAADFLGRVVWEVFPGNEGTVAWAEYHRAQAEQAVSSFEEYSHDFGRWFEHRLFPSPDGLTVCVRDVTARREEEAERSRRLVEHEKRFRALIENSSDAVVIVAADGTTLYASPSCERVDGVAPERRPGASIFTAVHPEDEARQRADFTRLVGARGAIVSGKYRVRRVGGRWMWIEVVGQNLLHDPAIAGVVITFRDVSERHAAEEAYLRAQEALERSERHHRALIDHGRDLISIVDAAGTIRYASPSHVRVLGWAPDELVGTSGLALVHEDDVADVAAAFAETSRSSVSVEFRYRHKDGSWRFLEAIGSSPPPDAGLDGYVVNARDVTARKSAEERTRVLLDVARDLASVLDETELLDRVQRHVMRATSCDAVVSFRRDPARGVFVLAAHAGLPPDAVPVIARLEMPDGAFTAGRLDLGTLVVNDVDAFQWARPFDVTFTTRCIMVAPLRIRGRHVASLVAIGTAPGARFEREDEELFTGIADQVAVALERVELHQAGQEAAEVFGALARTGQELLASFDTPRLLDRLCAVTADVLACDSSHTLLWLPEDAAFVPVAAHGVTADEREALRVAKLPRDVVIGQLQRLGGETLQLFVAGTAEAGVVSLLRLPEGAPVVCLALRRGEDIIGFQLAARTSSQRPFSEAELRIARGIAHLASMALEHARINDALDRANRLKSEFVAMMSHELRTPLNPIIGYGDLLLEGTFGPLTEEQVDVLRRVQRSSRGLLELIDEVLDVSRLESGRVTLDLAETAIDDLLRVIEAETLELRRGADVVLAIDVTPPLPRVVTDPAKLKVVVKNLVVNALKFTARGRVTVRASFADGGVALEVADTGIGIPPASLDVIFEPFRQVGGADGGRGGGVGLGLYIVRRLVDVLGGTVSVESRLGSGTTFRVWIPDAQRARAADESPDQPALAAGDTHVAVVRSDGTIVAVNDAWRRFAACNGASDRSRTDVGASYFAACRTAVGPDAITALEARVGIQSVLDGMRERFSLEYRCDAQQRERWFLMTVVPHPGHAGEVLVMHTDVTQHRYVQEIAARQLPTDPLTGLPNKVFFAERLAKALTGAGPDGSCVGVLYVDLDRFKRVNEACGRAAGDHVLQLVARRLEEALGSADMLCRPGGDEFLVLATGLEGFDDLSALAARALAAFTAPFAVDGRSLQLDASLGLVLAPEDGCDVETLLRRADIALSEAKRGSRGGAVRFVPGPDAIPRR